MTTGYSTTGLWEDIAELPDALQRALDEQTGWSDAVTALSGDDVRRIVVSGNGASYYAGFAVWLAALLAPRRGPEIMCVPSGLLADGRFAWADGDVLLAISSSGEFRDLIHALDSTPRPVALVTGTVDSTLATRADLVASFDLPPNRAVTHTQDYCCATLTALAIWASITNDPTLQHAVSDAPASCQRSIELTAPWASEHFPELALPTAAVAFGHRSGWAAALEAALLIKEIPQIPCEGLETREGATSAMTGMGPGTLVLTLPTREDPFLDEAETLCAQTGATVLRGASDLTSDPRLAPIAAFPAAAALAAELAIRRQRSVDNPNWIDTYYATARLDGLAAKDA